MKTQPPRFDKKQYGKANSKPTIKIGQRSKLCPAQRNPVKILKRGSEKLEGKSKNYEDNGSGEPLTNQSRVSIGINLGCVENRTPEGKIASVCGLDSVCFDYCQKVNEGSILKTVDGKNSDTTAVKTPPVEASVSPEIQFGSHSKMQILKSAATPVCYGAGHLLSGVTDKRKCRRRGSLKGGCEKFNLFDDEKKDDNVIPLPAEASVRWVLSPCDEEREDLESKLEKCKMIGENDLLSSPLGHDVIENNSALSLGSLSSGNIIQTPSSGSSSYGCIGGSSLGFVEFELDSITKTLNKVAPSISGIGLQCEDMTRVQENTNSVCSWVSDCTLENLTLSQTRISWRDGLVSRIDENDDEFDCCRCLSDEEVDAAVGCEKQLSPTAQPGVDIESESALNCISARGNERLSPCRLNASAESICTIGGDLVASGDSDWICFQENHLF
ncbi:hypothetical protein PHJA_002940500 [Phtheirospermum japonicum]|uniref:Uncharacterized protein n=1 Tax=Phtheirospermum japonicum TaxID=374723 RepID=A0A830DIJ3_9LAMI|nr:hypothetical protein PHJA_002940500 [Phtheirospermum japonicum]